MSISPTVLPHPISRCAEELSAALDRVEESEPLYLSTEAKQSVLVDLARSAERVRALLLRVLATADDVALESGARSAAAWLAHETRVGYAAAARAGRLSAALDARWQVLSAAFAAGSVTEAQAHVIVDVLDTLPEGIEPALLAKAEAHLVEQATHFEPKRLRILGRHILDVIAPDIADEEERRKLEAEERAARRVTRLSLRSRGDGTTDLHARVPNAVAARLQTYLEAMTSPRRGSTASAQGSADTLGALPTPRRWGEAFCALLERLPDRLLPQHGGTATTLIVTMPLDALRTGLGLAECATGETITAGQARRLACNARIIPAVLGGASEVLDLGRSSRLYNSPQRKAMAIRDLECRTDGCTVPAAWCEAHHLKPWAAGGKTNLDDGLLLCSWHHHRAHDDRYDLNRMSNGDVRFHRRR